MWKYEVYLSGGATIGGEIEDADAIFHLVNTGDGAKIAKLTDSEGVMYFKPDRIEGASCWQETTGRRVGYSMHE